MSRGRKSASEKSGAKKGAAKKSGAEKPVGKRAARRIKAAHSDKASSESNGPSPASPPTSSPTPTPSSPRQMQSFPPTPPPPPPFPLPSPSELAMAPHWRRVHDAKEQLAGVYRTHIDAARRLRAEVSAGAEQLRQTLDDLDRCARGGSTTDPAAYRSPDVRRLLGAAGGAIPARCCLHAASRPAFRQLTQLLDALRRLFKLYARTASSLGEAADELRRRCADERMLRALDAVAERRARVRFEWMLLFARQTMRGAASMRDKLEARGGKVIGMYGWLMEVGQQLCAVEEDGWDMEWPEISRRVRFALH